MLDISKLNQPASAAQKLAEGHQGAIDVARHIADSSAIQAVMALDDSVVSRVLADIERHQAPICALEELRRAGVFDHASAFDETLGPVREMTDEFNARFTLPEGTAAVKLIQEFQQSHAAGALARYAGQADEIQRAMEAMHTPWLNVSDVNYFVRLATTKMAGR